MKKIKLNYLSEDSETKEEQKLIGEEKYAVYREQETAAELTKAHDRFHHASPFTDMFSKLIKAAGCRREKYMGGIMSGISCERFLKQAESVCEPLLSHTLTGPNKRCYTFDEAKEYKGMIKLLNTLKRISDLIHRSTTLCKCEQDELDKSINTLISQWRITLPHDQPTPKRHWLSVHIMPFVRAYGSVGRYGEQSTERLHAGMNRCSRYMIHIQNTLTRLSTNIRNTNIRRECTTHKQPTRKCPKGHNIKSPEHRKLCRKKKSK
jgi:hypothetical protein